MTEQARQLGNILSHPLVIAAIAAGLAGYIGFERGQTTITSRMDKIEADYLRMDRRDDEQDSWLRRLDDNGDCRTRQIDRLNEKAGLAPLCETGG